MAEYRLRFTADVDRSIRSISDLKKEVAKVTKEFHEAEIGTRDFANAGQALDGLKRDLKGVTNQFKDQRREIDAAAKALANYRAGMGARGAIPKVASPIGGSVDIFGSPAQLQAMRQAQEETERLGS